MFGHLLEKSGGWKCLGYSVAGGSLRFHKLYRKELFVQKKNDMILKCLYLKKQKVGLLIFFVFVLLI